MAVVGWIALALLGLIVIAFFIPVRISVEYIQGWRIGIRLFGAIPVWTYPTETTPKDQPKPPVQTEEPPTEEKQEKKPSVWGEIKALFAEEGVGGVLSFFGKLIALLTTTLASLVRFITIRKLALCVRVSGDEADKTAVTYGHICTAATNGLTVLSKLVRVKRPTIRIIPDFVGEQTDVRLRMIVWVWPFGVVGVGITALFRFLALWMPMTKPRPNGAKPTTTQPKSK